MVCNWFLIEKRKKVIGVPLANLRKEEKKRKVSIRNFSPTRKNRCYTSWQTLFFPRSNAFHSSDTDCFGYSQFMWLFFSIIYDALMFSFIAKIVAHWQRCTQYTIEYNYTKLNSQYYKKELGPMFKIRKSLCLHPIWPVIEFDDIFSAKRKLNRPSTPSK